MLPEVSNWFGFFFITVHSLELIHIESSNEICCIKKNTLIYQLYFNFCDTYPLGRASNGLLDLGSAARIRSAASGSSASSLGAAFLGSGAFLGAFSFLGCCCFLSPDEPWSSE